MFMATALKRVKAKSKALPAMLTVPRMAARETIKSEAGAE
jgi:hypothetical protein